MGNDDKLLEPLDAFNKYYENAFKENATAYFDDLVEKSRVDIEQNRKTVGEYKTELARAEKAANSLTLYKLLRVLCIILCVVGFFAAALGISVLIQESKTLTGVLMISIGAVVGAGMILIATLVLSPKINVAKKKFDENNAKANKLLQTAWTQMSGLNALFESNATKTLIEKTVPLLKIDDNFDMRRYDYLSGKYGFGDNEDESRSTIALVSGEILGNPFVIDREIVQGMRNFTYTGSLVISWTTTYTDSDGHVHTQHHTQTLTASVDKPKPEYSEQTRLIYGNDAAPNLVFSHEPTHAEKWSKKKLEREVKSGAREIQKQQKKDITSGGGTFTEMGNAEFDVMFNALDRNNEVQFRLLFTPLAQKNMLALMKDGAHYGDDFVFNKRKCLNYVSSEHSASWDLDTGYSRYVSFDIDAARKNFMSFNTAYFRNFYFEFAPLLSIPLYQQQKPKEYIYRENYPRNYTSYEAECAVNRVGEQAFPCEGAATRSILKTSFLGKDGASDAVGVTAHAFRTEQRVEYKSVFGGDGRVHSVPVYWDEYIPIESYSTVKLKQLNMTDKAFEQKLEDKRFESFLGAFGAHAYGNGLLCCKVDDSDTPFDSRFGEIDL